MRYISIAHSIIVVLPNSSIKESSDSDSKTSILIRVDILVKCSEDGGHNKDEAAHNEHKTESVADHSNQSEEQFWDDSHDQEVAEESQPTDAKHKYHEIVDHVFGLGLEQQFRRDCLDKEHSCNVKDSTESVHYCPFIYADLILWANVEHHFEYELE